MYGIQSYPNRKVEYDFVACYSDVYRAFGLKGAGHLLSPGIRQEASATGRQMHDTR